MIVIAGDSYSKAHDQSCMPHPKYSWAGNMIRAHGGYGIAVPGSNNLDILDRLLPYKDLQCPFIINFSHLVRGSGRFKYGYKKYSTAVIHKLNIEAARKTMQLFGDRALFWTPFPGYEQEPGIQSIFQLEEDELWLNRDETGKLRGFNSYLNDDLGVLGNHLTRKGNDYLFDRFSEWVEAHPLYKKSEPILFTNEDDNDKGDGEDLASGQHVWTNWTNLDD